MESVLGRYRNLIILVGVLFLQVLGLAVQVKRGPNSENTRLIRVWAVDLITPLERVVVRAQGGAGDLWRNYFYLRGVRAENRELKQQIEEMRLQQVRLSEDAAQARRLQALLAFKEQYVGKTVAAQVIGSGASDLSRSIYLDKGSNDGIAPDMAVITANGIVGKVLRVYPSTSLVLMINDQSSGVGVLLEKSRLQVSLHGTPNGELMLEHVMSDESVTPGESVLSSGGDQIFPKGLPVGTVTKVSPGHEMLLNIKVKPAADLNRLEEVLVVTEKQERQPVTESGGRVRAADVLALRLPSVPDKPAVTAPGANAAGQGAAATANGAAKPPNAPAAKLSTAASGAPSPAKLNNAGVTSIPSPSNPAASTRPPGSKPAASETSVAGTSASPNVPKAAPPAKSPSASDAASLSVSPKKAVTSSPDPGSTDLNPKPDAAEDNPH
ncbi:MAG TPA: rod shape-determining protein MreC [Candidatus Binatia bacterium]|nr:rod shape-determining protein MreC [Candidatus Binatia bacterium]